MNPDSPVSLCMIVRDEEWVLSQCLSSVADMVSEVIILDTGSVDATCSIAEKYGAQVISYSWQSDFAAARNESLKLATKPWILVLDADECVADGQKEKLCALCADEAAAGYELQIKSLLGHQGDEQVTDYVCRLFRNDPEIKFSGSIHEQIASAVQAKPGQQLKRCDLEIIHYGYLTHIIEQKNKTERNLRLIKEALAADSKNRELLYALGTEYFQQADYSQALPIFEPLLASLPVTEGYASDLFLKTMYALRETGRAKDALQQIEQGLTAFPNFADLQELHAVLLMDEGQDNKALHVLDGMCISREYTSVSGAGTYRTAYLQGMLLERQGQWKKACESYRVSLEYRPDYVPAWQRWLPLVVGTGQIEQLNDWVKKHGIPKKVQLLVFYLMLDLQQPAWIVKHKEDLQGAFLAQPWIEALLQAQIGEYSTACRYIQPWVQSPAHREPTETIQAALEYSKTALKLGHRGMQTGLDKPQLHRFSSAADACQMFIRIGAWYGFSSMLRSDPSPGMLLSALSPAMKMALVHAPIWVVEQLRSLLEQELQREGKRERKRDQEPDEILKSHCYMLWIALHTRMIPGENELLSDTKLRSFLQEQQEKYIPASEVHIARCGWNALTYVISTPLKRSELHPLVLL
ncbi:glycosyltransferase [Paenibacillus polygoni]|uniref:Glycosyltransferase n=1 Tax=Paenibacillus polygoni TaxID=3050112 RepID=A0ABY8X0Z6_9BACL|nr:TPR domain-containing glycosyltransferase [Paenibacillus polygoni]WIV19070.1 glycosyltransferase [Paenibacillus polygoni]